MGFLYEKIKFIFMDQAKIETYKIWYKILTIIGLVGIVDLVTRSFVSSFTDIGLISLGALYLFGFLFGVKAGATISVLISSIISGFSPIWLILAYFINRKIKSIENHVVQK